MFDTFRKIAEITKDQNRQNNGESIKKLNKPGKWIQVKLELRGNGITIEDLIINNQEHKPVL